MRIRRFQALGAFALATAPLVAQTNPPRIGVISGAMGSFAATILKAHQTPFENVTAKLSTDSLSKYGLLVVDNLFKLQDLTGPAFKSYVENGGVLLIINPKVDGFSRTWSPYDIFVGEYTLEAKIENKKHPLFNGFTDDKLKDFAKDVNGPYVGNCSIAEPGKEWKVLAKQSKDGKNPVVVEAAYGNGWFIVTCTRFDQYPAKPAVTRYGDNLIAYALSKAKSQ
ncbi:MAG: hypothetical protein ABI647_00315 [Gemmatimonadota bacterium]